MPGQASQDLFSQAVDLFAQRVNEYADGIAQRLGQPMSGQQLSKDQVLDRWNYTPLGNTQQADAQYHQLVAQGTPPGQALDQVYPFRKMLFSAPDLKTAIDTAGKIAGWSADATGTEPPQPNPRQSPILPPAPNLAQPPALPPPGLPAPAPGGMPPMAAPLGMPPMGGPLPPPPPVPQGMPMSGLGQPMPQIAPVAQPVAGSMPIPAMAGGGVVTQPTLALIGEAGPEAVVPLSQQGRDRWALTAPGQAQVGYGQDNFIASLRPVAEAQAQATGIPANVYLAIAANETGWGKSQTAQQNNLFSVQGSGANGNRWATYDDPQQSFNDFAQLLATNPRYATAWAARSDPAQFLTELRRAGYVADEPGYPAQAWVNQVQSIYNWLGRRQQASAPAPAQV